MRFRNEGKAIRAMLLVRIKKPSATKTQCGRKSEKEVMDLFWRKVNTGLVWIFNWHNEIDVQIK